MGVAINRVITMMYRVFNRLPAIPVVCFLALVTVVKNAQLTVRMPFTKTYRIIPSKSATASVAET